MVYVVGRPAVIWLSMSIHLAFTATVWAVRAEAPPAVVGVGSVAWLVLVARV